MMRYYKRMDGGVLTAIGIGSGGTEITAEEYGVLAEEIRQKSELVAALAAGTISAADIREDWRGEIVRRAEAEAKTGGYTQEELAEMSSAKLEQILSRMGVSVNMTKSNMVTLILALQGGGDDGLV